MADAEAVVYRLECQIRNLENQIGVHMEALKDVVDQGLVGSTARMYMTQNIHGLMTKKKELEWILNG